MQLKCDHFPDYRKLSFLFGGVSTVILLFFMFIDEDVAHIEHILQIVSILTLLAIISRFVYSAVWISLTENSQ